MKLLLCKNCTDVFSLSPLTEKTCSCGKTKGKYINKLQAEYSGEYAIPIGFTNNSLIEAISNQPIQGNGYEFIAFVIPKICKTFIK